ncbi:ABC transporter ATP-binding protein [Brachyspira pilosicoli]|uniref:ABC transporter ATP-binding protein n=1 Tax=Brachyspira pilosicoli TaxID=52584 RepID=UPI003005242F
MENILEIKNLHVHYIKEDETVKAVNGINLSLKKGESIGIVGETGAGKTTMALSVMGLIPYPPGIIMDGEIIYEDKNIIECSAKEYQQIRGNGISMIFQDPMTALNPAMTVEKQLMEVLDSHKSNMSKGEKLDTIIELLELVGVQRDRLKEYPHQFSGGMKQRVVIAMSLLLKPKILIADEPTTALDVTIQAQVLNIINNLKEKFDMSLILITHDLGVVAEVCDRVFIMYAGEIVESGSIKEVYLNTKHPYTKGLFNSIPRLDVDNDRLIPIEGDMVNPADLPSGCYFNPRCKYKKDICMEKNPNIIGDEHQYKCHFNF